MTASAARPGASQLQTIGLFAAVVLIFGMGFPAIKVGLTAMPPLLFAAARYAISGVLLLGVAAVTGRRWRPASRNDAAAVAAGGVLLIGGTGLNFVGLRFTSSGVSATIFAIIPVLTVAVAWVLLPAERTSKRGALGVLVGFVGAAVVVQSGPLLVLTRVQTGNLLCLSAAVSIALGTVLVKRCRATMSVIPLTAWAMFLGAALLLGVGVGVGESMARVVPTPAAVLALLYLAVFAGAIAYVVYFHLIQQIGPVQVNLTSYLTPVVATGVGWAVLGEPLSADAIGGLVVILVGFLLIEEQEVAAELARFRGATR